MKTLLTTAAITLAVTSAPFAFAQSETTGVSNPPAAIIDATPDAAPAPAYRPKPSAAVGYATAPAATTYGPYVPYNPSGTISSGTPMPLSSRDPDAEIVTSVAGQPSDSREDAGIVTHVQSRPNEVPPGTMLHTRIRETLSTTSTVVGSPFTAEVTSPMERNGRVIVRSAPSSMAASP